MCARDRKRGRSKGTLCSPKRAEVLVFQSVCPSRDSLHHHLLTSPTIFLCSSWRGVNTLQPEGIHLPNHWLLPLASSILHTHTLSHKHFVTRTPSESNQSYERNPSFPGTTLNPCTSVNSKHQLTLVGEVGENLHNCSSAAASSSSPSFSANPLQSSFKRTFKTTFFVFAISRNTSLCKL